MKKLIMLLTVAVFMAIPKMAVAQNLEDVVYLKNGSVIRGVIVEQVPNESLKIETRDGNLFVYRLNEVQKMTRETNADNSRYSTNRTRSNNSSSRSKFNKPRGYMGLVEIGGGVGIGSFAAHRISVSMINGYRVIPQFAVGVGVGSETFIYNDLDVTMPLFLHLRSDFINNKISPFVAFNIGYNLSLTGGYFGGLMFEPSAGVGFNIGRKCRFTVGLAYALNQVYYTYRNSNDIYSGFGGALKLKAGFSF